ncbi:class I SAM-dependent methyltransferase [Alteraurantiacibacter aestuarii]
MRISGILAAAATATATAALCLAAPASAQDRTREILGRVLDSVLGPQPQAQQPEAQPVPQTTTVAVPQMPQVLAHPRRNDDRVRDQYRHPAETLDFFGIRPGMTVVDYMPATGWYSRILIPFLGQQGTYIGMNPELDASLTGYWDMYRNAATRIPADASQWVGNEGARVVGVNTNDDLAAYAGSADRVLIFREIHNMRRFGWLHDSLVAARTLLKPDGMLGVVQHRADPDAPASYVLGDNGYQREEDVIALLSAYGFELVGRSEINANALDPANWEGGVWSLSPSFAGAAEGSRERRRRAAIGESDRMTLLFRKRA